MLSFAPSGTRAREFFARYTKGQVKISPGDFEREISGWQSGNEPWDPGASAAGFKGHRIKDGLVLSVAASTIGRERANTLPQVCATPRAQFHPDVFVEKLACGRRFVYRGTDTGRKLEARDRDVDTISTSPGGFEEATRAPSFPAGG